MNSVLSNINTASGRPDDAALQWAQQASDESVTDEQLCNVPPEFVILSREIMAKLQNNATGELGLNITQIVEDWLKAGRSAPGLLILRTVSRYFATGRAPDALCNLKDLERVQLKGGNLEGVLNTWYMVINGMKKVPDIEMQELIFNDAIKDQRELAEDIAHYNRLGEESKHEDRSFDYLLNFVNRSIRVKRHEVNKKACPKA
jgi:hypothetical protein